MQSERYLSGNAFSRWVSCSIDRLLILCSVTHQSKGNWMQYSLVSVRLCRRVATLMVTFVYSRATVPAAVCVPFLLLLNTGCGHPPIALTHTPCNAKRILHGLAPGWHQNR